MCVDCADAYARQWVEAFRERAAKVALNPYSDEVGAVGGRKLGDEPLAVGKKIAAAIRALRKT